MTACAYLQEPGQESVQGGHRDAEAEVLEHLLLHGKDLV